MPPLSKVHLNRKEINHFDIAKPRLPSEFRSVDNMLRLTGV